MKASYKVIRINAKNISFVIVADVEAGGSVIELDDKPVGDGSVGPVWDPAMRIYEPAKYGLERE